MSIPNATYAPSATERAEIEEWFATYDRFAAARDVEAMADMAVFPLNEVTDDGAGNGSATQVDRAAFVAQMAGVIGDGDVRMESTRTPHFLSEALVFVVTEAVFTHAGGSQAVRYGDLLVRSGGRWRFQTMVQGGWGTS
ncbi:MAG: nuclear transport factor 2 family protein [Pseudonocardia sp.]